MWGNVSMKPSFYGYDGVETSFMFSVEQKLFLRTGKEEGVAVFWMLENKGSNGFNWAGETP